MEKTLTARHTSPSIAIILNQLRRLGMNKTNLAQQLGVSQDYVYRILNGRIPFPHTRETLSRMADVLQLEPYVFAEFRALDAALSISTRLVWQRMKELRLSREDLFSAMGGRISRPYFNSILRGDQPFPTNRAYIQLFALALELPPGAFVEFGPLHAPRWGEKELREMEERVFHFFFDKMMAARGYIRQPMPFESLDETRALAFFAPAESLSPALQAVLVRMGELGMGFRELEKVTGVAPALLRALFCDPTPPAGAPAAIAEIQRTLHLS